MTDPHVALLEPLLVGVGTTICTVPIHAVGMAGVLRFFNRETGRGFAGSGFAPNIAVVSAVVLIALLAHLIEITMWAAVFLYCGEFQRFAGAFYHSAMNYTTLGYGDIVMSPDWRLLGPLEAADGMLMFGVTTAFVFGIVVRLVQTRLHLDRWGTPP